MNVLEKSKYWFSTRTETLAVLPAGHRMRESFVAPTGFLETDGESLVKS